MNPIIGTPTLPQKIGIFLGEDGEVTSTRWFRRGLWKLIGDERFARWYGVEAWWGRRWDSDSTNDARGDEPGVSLGRRF